MESPRPQKRTEVVRWRWTSHAVDRNRGHRRAYYSKVLFEPNYSVYLTLDHIVKAFVSKISRLLPICNTNCTGSSTRYIDVACCYQEIRKT